MFRNFNFQFFMSVSIFCLLCVGITSCAPEKKSSSTIGSCISSGDIIVSNSGSDVVLVLDSNGYYKNIAFNVSNTAETVYGVAWSQATNEVLVAVDGADRIVAVSASDCSSRTFIADVNLTGNIRGITQLLGGDLLVVESNNVERFNTLGYRVTAGWPRALQTTGTDINKLANGGFTQCSTGSDVVRTYTEAGVQVNTAASGIAGTTDVTGCIELLDGNIAAVFSGTTDTVKILSPDLGTTIATYSDTSILSTPGGIAKRANGNILVIDRVLHYIVELTSNGTFVNVIGDGVLSTPEHVLVIP